VIYTEEGVFQEYRFYRKNPDLVLVDTQVIAQAPPRLLVAGMGTHWPPGSRPGRVSPGSVRNMRGGGSTATALALAELCYRTLLADGAAALLAVSTQVVHPSLERLVEANTLLSGLGFESSGLAAAHAVHNGLTASHDTHAFLHGEKVAFGLLVQLRPRRGSARRPPTKSWGFQLGRTTDTLADIGLPQPTARPARPDRPTRHPRPARPSTTSRSRSLPKWSPTPSSPPMRWDERAEANPDLTTDEHK